MDFGCEAKKAKRATKGTPKSDLKSGSIMNLSNEAPQGSCRSARERERERAFCVSLQRELPEQKPHEKRWNLGSLQI